MRVVGVVADLVEEARVVAGVAGAPLFDFSGVV